MKKLFLLFTLSLLLVGMAWGANLVDENIQNWTTQGSYGTYTQTIAAGTVNMANCMVQPGATASGVATAGRVQVKASTGILELPELSSIGTISFNLVAGGANRTLKLQKLNGATWEDITTISGIGTTGDTFSHALNTPSATQIRLTNASAAVYVHDILVTDNSGGVPTPLISVAPSTLTGFTYEEGSGPSTEQSFSISGSNLDGNAIITAPMNYQISSSSGSGFVTSLQIDQVAGTVDATTIYVRMIAGLSAGSYNDETIDITSGTASPQLVTLSGNVTTTLPTDGYLVNFDGEGEEKPSYASDTVNLSGLDWDMTEALIGTDAADWKNGLRSARLRGYGTSSLTMLEDKTGGLGTLSFPYRSYSTDAQVAWKAEYSSDAGATWNQIGADFTGTAEVQTFSEVVNVAGNVRIKISSVPDTGTSNRRLNIDDILLTDYAGGTTPSIFATGTFTDFATFTGTPSASQSYSLSGAALTSNISITAPAGFQVSTDNAAFAQTKSVPSTFNGPIYVRLSGASAGTFSGNIAHTSTGATAVNLPVSGTVIAPTPTISLSGTLNAFTTTPGTPSAAQHYSVEGVYLTANIAIAAPAGFELSLTQAGTYTPTLQLNRVGGTVAATDVYVRLTGLAAGTFSGNISHSSGAVTQNMAVTGTVAVSTTPHAEILLRPSQISLADATHESAVLVKVENYPSEDARYRIFNGSNQYNPWDAATSDWITVTSYGSGPQIPGTPSSSVSWWIPFQRGNNNTIVASYRDRLGTGYTT
ncbi:MAG: hypothetical protein LHW56_11445, partial [Candidatus Cloacimonetes bacterium]|nr:hypothetical protein [Candidatus Cloacimonadota bacterium]MDY0173502.1 hypothetical protein [Candidatus Cloacimonadaceae bacterium]